MNIRKAHERAGWLSHRIGQEVVTARKARGWSQRELARRVAASQTMVSRVERGWSGASVRVLCQLTAALGLDFAPRIYPADGIAVRDERQLRLVRLIVARTNPSWHPSIESRASPDPSDHRAIDLLLSSAVEVCALEVERDLQDVQGQLRADLLKRDLVAQRESRPVRFVLALPDSRRLRRLVRTFAPLFATLLPASSRHVWASIRSGKPIGADGLLWLPSTGPAPSVGSVGTQTSAERAAVMRLSHQTRQNDLSDRDSPPIRSI